jgi:hypothetical protein
MKAFNSFWIVVIAIIAQGCATQQTRFASPDEAANALVSAVRDHDRARLHQILGPECDEVIHSGDDVADREAGQRFITAYDAKHQLANNADGSVTLEAGESDWPLPIPIVKDEKTGMWAFDTAAGADEILNRRIGRNELDVIQVCQAICDAQREYAERDPDGDGIPEYAAKFLSDPGEKNGLYWPTAEGETESPLGPLVGDAVEEGYSSARTDTGEPRPYHGYYYRMLSQQGPDARGGAIHYLINGQWIGGYAVIAWPADYGNSGIMTFIVNYDETVYQKDLGEETDSLARAITSFDPGEGWTKADEPSGPLSSWNDGPSKQAIVGFVARVTMEGGADFVKPGERIAVFDNDGTLWAEQPMYFQLFFAMDRVKAMAPEHPEWKEQEPFKSILAGDVKTALAGGEKSILQLIAATHAGMTVEEFRDVVQEWAATARHPKTGRLFTEMVYRPMLELLAYLRDNGFKTFIVSGGGVEFMRPWTEKVYGIPPEQVVGSRGKLKYELIDGKPVIYKLAEIDLIDDGPGKPVGIQQVIGRQPIAAFGNSDGDLQMLQWTAAGEGARFCLFVHHTDAVREWAYDRDSHIGRLDKGLDMARERGWSVMDMKSEWKVIYPFNNLATPMMN